MPKSYEDQPLTFKTASSPEDRAKLAVQILTEHNFEDCEQEFHDYLYPGKRYSREVFDLIKKEVLRNPKLAEAILDLGHRGVPFRRDVNIDHADGFIYAACMESLKEEYSSEDLVRRFVDIIYNSDERFPRSDADLKKLSALNHGRKVANNLSLLELGNDVIGNPNLATSFFKIQPVLNHLSAYFLHSKKKTNYFTDKKNRVFSISLQRGVDNVYLVQKGMELKSGSKLLSMDYYHNDRLVASVDTQRNTVTLFNKENDNIFPYFYEKQWLSYKRYETDAVIEYPGFTKLCKNFAKENKLTPKEQVK